ncbi:MAG: hypothetical protein V3S54_09260 [Woeseiaceae bacterium]
MAIVKFGPTVVGARGTIAGTIFSANRGGPYARGWSRGSNPSSSLQLAQRSALAQQSSDWRDLTVAQQDDWIDYADDPPQELTNSLGETYFASGPNWFVRINLHLVAAGEATRVDAPTLTRPLAPILDTATRLSTTAGVGNTRVQFTVASPNLGFNHVMQARVTDQGRTAIAAGFKFQIIAVPNVSRIVVFQDEIEATFGTIILGQRMFMQARSQDSHGQRSPFVQGTFDAIFSP